MPDRLKTYVLIGSNRKDQLNVYANNSDYEVISFEDYPNIEDAIKAIKPPANIILECHGNLNYEFQWKENEFVPYDIFFEGLPKNGIISITLGSCYGGSAQDLLSWVPPGVILQSMTGPETLSSGNFSTQFAIEAAGLTKPVNLFLETLDNFDPVEYKKYIEYWNKQWGQNHDSNPEHALPHILGIGGNPAHIIDLNEEIKGMKAATIDHAAMQRAVSGVQERFDTFSGGLYQGDNAERKLDADIAVMAKKLQQGIMPKNVEEKRLAYAITAAYMDESGELQKLIEKTPDYTPVIKLDASGMPIKDRTNLYHPQAYTAKSDNTGVHNNSYIKNMIDEKIHAKSKNITDTEQAYIDSVRKKLSRDPEVEKIISKLEEVFKKTKGEDLIDINSELDKQLQGKGISVKSWTL